MECGIGDLPITFLFLEHAQTDAISTCSSQAAPGCAPGHLAGHHGRSSECITYSHPMRIYVLYYITVRVMCTVHYLVHYMYVQYVCNPCREPKLFQT